MGVMNCSRLCCDNIMCYNYSPAYGYICPECLAELESKPFINISIFMNTPKEYVFEDEEIELWENTLVKCLVIVNSLQDTKNNLKF